MTKFYRISCCLLAVGLLFSGAVAASGIHYKVSTSARFYADSYANLAGVRMNWVYDAEVSAIILEGREQSPEGLQELADDMMADLYRLDYFTVLSVNGVPAALAETSDYSIKLTDAGNLQLGMQLPLEQAVALAGKTVTMVLADPDNTADLLYATADRVVLDEELAAKCSPPDLQSKLQTIDEHELTIQTVSVACP